MRIIALVSSVLLDMTLSIARMIIEHGRHSIVCYASRTMRATEAFDDPLQHNDIVDQVFNIAQTGCVSGLFLDDLTHPAQGVSTRFTMNVLDRFMELYFCLWHS
jgi:hypothetical protein